MVSKKKRWWGPTLKCMSEVFRPTSIPVIRDNHGTEYSTNPDNDTGFGQVFASNYNLGTADLEDCDLSGLPRRCTFIPLLHSLSHQHCWTLTQTALSTKGNRTRWCPIACPEALRCYPWVTPPLSRPFTLYFELEVQPSMLKSTNVIPVHKKQSRGVKKLYRPVSLLSIVSKIMDGTTSLV